MNVKCCLQKLDVKTEDGEAAIRLGDRMYPWIQHVLLGATILTALSINFSALACPPILSRLPVLRELELTASGYGRGEKAWLADFLMDLRYCSTLEWLRIADLETQFDYIVSPLPDMVLDGLTNLRHLELHGWFPERSFALPPGCVLLLEGSFEHTDMWAQHWQKLKCQAVLLQLDFWNAAIQAWPAGLEHFGRLQFLWLGCCLAEMQDIAALQGIPHVFLQVQNPTSLLLTAGTWESLLVVGLSGFDITFSNIDAFVQGTTCFSFIMHQGTSQSLHARLQEACDRQGITYFRGQYVDSPHGAIPREYLTTEASVAGTADGSTVIFGAQVYQAEFWPIGRLLERRRLDLKFRAIQYVD